MKIKKDLHRGADSVVGVRGQAAGHQRQLCYQLRCAGAAQQLACSRASCATARAERTRFLSISFALCLEGNGMGPSRDGSEIGIKSGVRCSPLCFAVQERPKTPKRKNPQTSNPLRLMERGCENKNLCAPKRASVCVCKEAYVCAISRKLQSKCTQAIGNA